MRDYDDYVERDCECDHTEHRGPCPRKITVYYPAGAPVHAGAEPTFTHQRAVDGGLTAYRIPCRCEAFREYEGPLEPPDVDREAS